MNSNARPFKFCRHLCRSVRRLPASKLSVLTILLVGITMPIPALADRSSSLGSNQLFEDRDDIFVYPGRLLEHSGVISFDMGTSEGAGNGFMLFDLGAISLGVAAHRNNTQTFAEGSLLSSQDREEAAGLGGVSGRLNLGPAPAEVIDLMVGFEAAGFDMGLRFGTWTGFVNQEGLVPTGDIDDNGNPVKEKKTRDSHQTGFGLVYGLGSKLRSGWTMDASFGLSQTSANDNNQFTATDEEGSETLFGADLRLLIPMTAQSDMGVFVSGRLASTSGQSKPANTSTVNSAGQDVTFGLGAGPRYRDEDGGQAGLYAMLAVVNNAFDPNTDQNNDQVRVSGLIIPGVRMAVEWPFKDWLKLRGGLEYRFSTATVTANGGDDVLGSNETGFNWSAGFGAHWKRFELNGTFNHSCLTLQCSGGLMTMVSGAYRFGRLGSRENAGNRRPSQRGVGRDGDRRDRGDRERDAEGLDRNRDRGSEGDRDERRDEDRLPEVDRVDQREEEERGGRRRMRR